MNALELTLDEGAVIRPLVYLVRVSHSDIPCAFSNIQAAQEFATCMSSRVDPQTVYETVEDLVSDLIERSKL